MTTTTPHEPTTKTGSIAVYQRLLPKRPAKVEVIRAVHETCKGPDGKAFGRTNNTVLLRIKSGTAILSKDERTKLVLEFGLDEKQIDYINTRLASLAGPAQARQREMDILDAKAKLKSLVALSESAPSSAKDLRAILTLALHEVEERMDADDGPADLGGRAPTESLKDTLALINHACDKAQKLYKRLPKGDLPDDLILEFQKSWFLHQDMVDVLRNRKCLSRQAGWYGLRAQVLSGNLHKIGDPIPVRQQLASYDSTPNP
jgi:RNase P/RNase MRP subunit p29